MRNKMKPLVLIPLFGFSITSCQNASAEKIYSPTGAPSLAFYHFSQYQNFETNSISSNVLSEIRNGSRSIIVAAPTQGGIQAINREIKETGKSDFQISSNITFGNYFFVSTGKDDNATFDSNDDIVLFGRNEIPDKLFQKIYGDIYKELLAKGHIHYVNSASDASSVIKTGQTISEGGGLMDIDYVLGAEPSIEGALKGNPNAFIYSNIQELYKSLEEDNEVIQASLFVNTSYSKSKIDSLLNKIMNDITLGIENPQLIKEGLLEFGNEERVKMIFGIPNIDMIVSIIKNGNKIGLGYKKAIDNKKAIDHFINDIAPSIGETNEKIYYK